MSNLIKIMDRQAARNMKRLRQQRGWTQEDLACAARDIGFGWTRDRVASVESGRRRLTVGEAAAVARVFNTALVEIVGALPDAPPVARTLPDQAELKAADALSVYPAEIMEAAQELWGRPLADERNSRALEYPRLTNSRGLQAVRGHITRTLYAELSRALGIL